MQLKGYGCPQYHIQLRSHRYKAKVVKEKNASLICRNHTFLGNNSKLGAQCYHTQLSFIRIWNVTFMWNILLDIKQHKMRCANFYGSAVLMIMCVEAMPRYEKLLCCFVWSPGDPVQLDVTATIWMQYDRRTEYTAIWTRGLNTQNWFVVKITWQNKRIPLSNVFGR